MSQDCRKPVLQSTRPVARLGHESGFSEDGKTYYATGTAFDAISAIDVTDPKNPHSIWQGNITSHGMSLSPDGNRGYLADPDGELLILDTSEIQARKANPQAREISRLTWRAASIPQNAIPFSVSRQAVPAGDRRVHAGHHGRGQRRRGGRRAHHRHLRRAQAQGRLEPAPPGEPARRPREGRRRPRRHQPGAGLRRALLRRVDPEGPDRGGVLVHRLRPARLRHQRSDQAEGDRLLRAAVAQPGRERLRRQQLTRCPSPRWCRAGARSGSPTA